MERREGTYSQRDNDTHTQEMQLCIWIQNWGQGEEKVRGKR